jgi:hypothetical protein
MEPSLSVSLRAHAVLLSATVSVFSVACLCAVVLLHVPLDHSGPFELRAAVFGLAILGVLYLRQIASRAFIAALRENRLGLSDKNGVAIAEDCPHGWLVQLHAELSPAAARRQIVESEA